MTYEVIFGSNVLMDCEGKVYVVEGSSNEENIIFSESDDGKILLNCAVKDKKGNTVVKIENSSVINVNDRYDLKEDNFITVTNKDTVGGFVELWRFGSNRFILNGKFYISGHEIIATDKQLKFDSSTFSNNMFKNPRKILSINTNGGVGIG